VSTLDRFSDRDRRALLLGLVIVVPVLLWMLAVRPYRDALAETKALVASERSLLAREEGLLETAGHMPDDLDAAEAKADRAWRRLVGTSDATSAEADVTDYIEGLATKSRVLLEEIRGMGPLRSDHPPPGVQIIRLSVSGESDLDGITALLRRMEEGTLLLRMSEMTMEPVVERRRTSTRGNNATTESRTTGYMQFTMTIEAFAPTGTEGADPMKESRP
jgi:hypothetical protein